MEKKPEHNNLTGKFFVKTPDELIDLAKKYLVGTTNVELKPGERALPFHLAPVMIVGVGALMVLASMFMPTLSSPYLDTISDNMLIQNNPVMLLCAITAIVAGIRYWNIGSLSSANLAIYAGLWFLGWSIYDSYNGQLEMVGGPMTAARMVLGNNVETHAGAGLWTAGVGSLIVALGGLLMRYPYIDFWVWPGPVISRDEQLKMSQTKTCPKCAETIKAAALVCRYCGHKFKPDSSSD